MEDLDIIFKTFPVLETENLILRQINLDDEKNIFEIYSDKEVMKYFGKHPIKTASEATAKIYKVINAFQNREGIRWGIVLKEDNELCGTGGFWRIIREHQRAEIGYDLAKKYWRRGIMKEALSEIINFGFNKMNLHTIEANTDPANIASNKLLESLGFIREGYTRESYFFDGRFTDTAIYSLLNEAG